MNRIKRFKLLFNYFYMYEIREIHSKYIIEDYEV